MAYPPRCPGRARVRPPLPELILVLLRSALLALCPLGAAMRSAPLHAQPAPWSTEEQGAAWYAGFVDHAVTDRTALWFDGQWRRMGLGSEPQQLLLRPGVQRTIAPGVRVAAGYAYIATAPYGNTPLATPLREQRSWQQIALSHRAGGVSLVHRYRWEQRWLSSITSDAGNRTSSAASYQHRARYMLRAQGNLPGVQLRDRPVLGFVWNELFLPIGHGNETLRLTQNRIGGGLGVPIDDRQRVEVGYMNLWNALATLRANEVNHTLTVSWVWIMTK
jgi:hypothetical protein